MKFRKKPVVIEAEQFFPENWLYFVALDPCIRAVGDFRYPGDLACLQIKTQEGDMTALPGDWIIKGVKGEYYPCKPDIFEAAYEPAE